LDATPATLPPALAIAPSELLWRAPLDGLLLDEVRREAEPLLRREAVVLLLFEPLRFELDRAFPDEPFLLVDLLVLELLLDDLLLEDRVVWAILIASLVWASLPAARSARRAVRLPT
jgi:hypothetical protein